MELYRNTAHIVRSVVLLAVMMLTGCAEEKPEQLNRVAFKIASHDLATIVVAVDRTLSFSPEMDSLYYLLRFGVPRYERKFEVYLAHQPSKKIKKIADVSDISTSHCRFLNIASDHVILEAIEDYSIWDKNFRINRYKITFEGEMSVVKGPEKLITTDEYYRIITFNQTLEDRSASRLNDTFKLNENKDLTWK